MAVGVATRSPSSKRRPLKLVSDSEVVQLRALAEKLQGRPLPGVHVTERQFVERYFHEDLNVEWVNGEVFGSPPASFEHIHLNLWLLHLIGDFVVHHDLGEVVGIEFQMRLAKVPSRRNPDVMFVSKANASIIQPTYLDGPADLAMEIVSPDSVARDWRDKYVEYEKSGVREYWLIDPAQQRCEAYSLARKKKYALLKEDDGRIFSKVLRGLYIRPVWLWQSPRPRLLTILKELGVR